MVEINAPFGPAREDQSTTGRVIKPVEGGIVAKARPMAALQLGQATRRYQARTRLSLRRSGTAGAGAPTGRPES